MRVVGDCREVLRDLPKGSVQTCVTSPPYWGLRDYGVKRQIGLERTPEAFVEQMVQVFRLVREVLADDGTLWLNLGDSYASDMKGSGGKGGFVYSAKGNGGNAQAFKPRRLAHGLKPKDLCGIPWRVAFALQADGWYLRSDIIWHKPNPMPESVTDRPTKSHEYLFLLTKGPRYFYDAEAIKEPAEWPESKARIQFSTRRAFAAGREPSGNENGKAYLRPATRNSRTVWTIATAPFPGAHFATFPPKLVEPCILAGTSEKGHCPQCGARWERETDVSYQDVPGGSKRGANNNVKGRGEFGVRTNDRALKVVETLGWLPTCDHRRKAVPDVVLDPFAGAGTTGMVAEQLGREFLGVELNPRYSKLAREAA